jgi:hypothetical protein
MAGCGSKLMASLGGVGLVGVVVREGGGTFEKEKVGGRQWDLGNGHEDGESR